MITATLLVMCSLGDKVVGEHRDVEVENPKKIPRNLQIETGENPNSDGAREVIGGFVDLARINFPVP